MNVVRARFLAGAATILLISTVTGGSAVAADVYDIDASHSVVLFKIKHLGIGNFYGRFNDLSGTVTVDGENPSASSVRFEIKAASIDTNNEKREQHVNSPDFLNSKQFPVIRFASDKVSKSKDGSYEVGGKLFLHGVEKPLTVQVVPVGEGKDPWGGYRAGFETTFTIKRSDFGMKYMLEGLSDEIELIVAVEGLRK